MQKDISVNAVATAAIAGALLTLAATMFTPQSAAALPVYAARTGLPCGQCHIDPGGGGPRNAFGRAFARNGHQLPGNGRRASPGARRSPNDRYRQPSYGPYSGYGMGPGMMGGYGSSMGSGMMGGYDR
jgi:hypothetical protein